MIDFDNIDDWAPELTDAFGDQIPKSLGMKLRSAAPKYVEDARDLLFRLADRETIIDATLAWIRSTTIAGYHGTRLTDDELVSLNSVGLLPLRGEARRNRLIRTLSRHPRWNEVAPLLDSFIRDYGRGNKMGHREGQVHLTLSRAGLINSFNHYLTHGAEFDQRVAQAILGTEGMDLLTGDGKTRLLQLAIPGDAALGAAHPYFSIEDMRANGDVPNVIDEFLKAWAHRLAYPRFQSDSLKVDCGMIFRTTVPSGWIVNMETMPT
jgi:hypothetical protein